MSRHRRRGQSLVEFALVLPVLLLLLMGIVDFGRLVYAYNAVSNVAREAARTAIINQDVATIRQRAAQEGTLLALPTADPGGCPATGGPSPTASAGTCVMFRSPDLSSACSPIELGCYAVVTVQWTFTPITPIIGGFVGNLKVNSESQFVIENVCPRSGVPLAQCLTR